jgi:hypothetical protein
MAWRWVAKTGDRSLTHDPLELSVWNRRRDQEAFFMSAFRHSVQEFIRVSENLLEVKDLSEKEEQGMKEMLRRLSVMFPDEGDDAAD